MLAALTPAPRSRRSARRPHGRARSRRAENPRALRSYRVNARGKMTLYIGRFLSPDPIEFSGGSNQYTYVDGNPVQLRDPSGLFATDPMKDPDSCCGSDIPKIIEYITHSQARLDEVRKTGGPALRDENQAYARTECHRRVSFGPYSWKTIYTEFLKRYYGSPGCVKACVRRHEEMHRKDCDTPNEDDELGPLAASVRCGNAALAKLQ